MPGFPMSGPHRQVAAETRMRVVSVREEISVAAALRYTTRDPFAVTMLFATRGCPPVQWVFARDLLVAGVGSPVGDGDVRVCPAGRSVVIDLISPDGSARLVADAAEMGRFVDSMLALVPLGDEAEYLDLDAELASLSREALKE